MKQRNIIYISIEETRAYQSHMDNGEQLETYRTACIQERLESGQRDVRLYDRVSEASILRLAKIQEKLAK